MVSQWGAHVTLKNLTLTSSFLFFFNLKKKKKKKKKKKIGPLHILPHGYIWNGKQPLDASPVRKR